MFKSMVTIFFLAVIFILGATKAWTIEDIEDRFINPDISTSKSIFIDVKDASLIDVLKIISKQSGLSFIASHDVEDRKITLYINKVPLNQALLMILDAYNLTYQMQEDSNVFVVTGKIKTDKTKITKVYQLKYATVSSSKLNSTISSSASIGGSSSSPLGSAGGSGGSSFSPGGKGGGMEDAVKDALSADGKIIEDTRTNSLIITDIPSQFDIIESTIAKLDVPVPQVLIEVEMIDVSKSTADNMGVTYGATPISFTGSSESVKYPLSLGRGSSTSSSSGSGSSSSSGSGSLGPFTPGSISTAGLTAALNFLSTNSDARTLARPRILTLNNQTAQIEISTDQAISVEQTQSSTSTGSAGTSVAGNTVERYTTGVILKVTPQANMTTREITMALSPRVIDVIQSQVVETGPGATPIYDPVTRGSDSVLKLRDGQSMVIGGLMTNQNNVTKTQLPILGSIPVLGALFRSSNKSKEERELLIFLTPHIIDDSNQSFLKGDGTSSVQAALDLQNAEDRAQEINSSLNNYDLK